MRKRLGGWLLAGLLLFAGGASAAVSFDPDGPGGDASVQVGTFDWAPSSILLAGGQTAVADCAAGRCGGVVRILTSSRMIGTLDDNGRDNTPAGLRSNAYEITMVMGVEATVIAVIGNQTALLNLDAARPSFLRWYFSRIVNADALAGTGFNDGQLILEGTFAQSCTGSVSTNQGTTPELLDQSPNGNQWGGQLTIRSNGQLCNALAMRVSRSDPAIFQSGFASLRYQNVSFALPFISVDPSRLLVDINNGLVAPAIGAVNAQTGSGPDALHQTDYNSPATGCAGAIGDFVWHDTNRNGIQEVGEPGINGVTVTLKNDAGNVIATTTTVANPNGGAAGYYQFGGLCAGNYQVEVPNVLGDGKSLTVANAGGDRSIDSNSNPALVSLPTDTSTDQTIDFGYVAQCSSSIGDFVWHDLNRNGIQDAGEPGINGVTVTLQDAAGTTIATTTTAANPATGAQGFYQFGGLCAGDYRVEVPAILADGKSPTVANAPGSNPANDSNPDPALVNLPTDNTSEQTIDFGYIAPCTGAIGDFVWHDVNRNGIQDSGETGITGVTVTLKNAANAIIATTTTGAGGLYQFGGLCAGTYTVEAPLVLGDGRSLTLSNAPGSTPANDSNGTPTTVVLPNDDASDQTIDFGYAAACTGAIGDFVWLDANRNGLQDAGEAGIPNVQVTLRNAADNAVLATAITDASGLYRFGGLCSGSYLVDVPPTLADGKTLTLVEQGNNRAVDSNPDPAPVTLPADDSQNLTIDFGYVAPCTGVIGDFVWDDRNRNGIQDAGEPGIAGATVTLKNAAGTVIATTTTNATGLYQFSGLCAGSYTVEMVTPPGFAPTVSNAPGSNPANDSNGSPAPVTLPADNSSNQTIDFGFVAPCTGAIGDFVWDDRNRNGIQDANEPGIAGATVRLKNAQGTVIATTTTNATGLYQFSGLCAGSYTVEVVTPAGLSPTLSNAPGSNAANDSNGSPAPVTLPADNSSNQTIDFGFVAPCTGAIGDFVWKDLNRNGIQDANEPGIAGATVRLKNAAGTAIATTTTNATGLYQFSGLCAGNYTVEVVTPAGLSPTLSNAPGSNPANDSNGSPAPVTLPADNSSNQTIDFGFVLIVAGEGCTPGYWKQTQHFDSWPSQYRPNMLFSAVFENAFPGKTLLQVLELGGGGLNALGRHTVAALLNSAAPRVGYNLSTAQVISQFNAVFPGGDYESLHLRFAAFNEQGCPLN